MGYINNYISNCYTFTSDYVLALEYNQKALQYLLRTNNYEGLALLYYQKSQIYHIVYNINDALKAINEGIEIYKKEKEPHTFMFIYMISKQNLLEIKNPKEAKKYLEVIDNYLKKNKDQRADYIFYYYLAKFETFYEEKNLPILEKLMPKLESQAKVSNSIYELDALSQALAKYHLLKDKKILNKKELQNSLETYKKNNENYGIINILNIFKDEAISDKNLQKVLEYDAEIKKIEKIIEEDAYRFKVNTFEKKLENAKKEKIIAQQKNEISKNKTYIIILAMILIILALATILYFSRKRKLEAKAETLRQEQFTFQLLQNTEEERSRIAGELHDSVNHDLLTIKNNLINGKTIVADDVSHVIEEVRNISKNLHPAVFETIGLQASIESLCERISEVGLFTTCDIEYTQKLPKNKELQLYRIIQEALNNTMKHGKAYAAKVILTSEKNALHLEVKDNGTGFNVNEQLKNPKSFGLQSILQRAKAIAAKININSTNDGTVILLKIPI